MKTDAERDYEDMRRFQAKFIESDQRVRHLESALEEIARCYGRFSLARHLARKALKEVGPRS